MRVHACTQERPSVSGLKTCFVALCACTCVRSCVCVRVCACACSTPHLVAKGTDFILEHLDGHALQRRAPARARDVCGRARVRVCMRACVHVRAHWKPYLTLPVMLDPAANPTPTGREPALAVTPQTHVHTRTRGCSGLCSQGFESREARRRFRFCSGEGAGESQPVLSAR